MLICRNTSIKPFNTFGLNYLADTIIHLKTEKEARAIFSGELKYRKPLMIIGGGSNLLFTGDFHGTILIPEFGRTRIEERAKDHVIVSAGAGTRWDRFVKWCCENGFWGIENLSGIPGNTGAVPVQNIGAYGVEVRELIVKVRTIRTSDGKVCNFSNEDCRFGYRTSIFKNKEKGRYLVTRIFFRLKLKESPNLRYGTLNEEVAKTGEPTLRSIRKAVLKIRQGKLPDPSEIGNAGSFFKNPVITGEFAANLVKKHQGLPVYDENSGMKKLAAGWLVEQCGWKGRRSGDTGVHEKQALVLVNHGNASGRDILDLSEKIRRSVREKFGIELEREVEVI